VCREGSGSPRATTRKAPEQQPQHGVGQSHTRGRAGRGDAARRKQANPKQPQTNNKHAQNNRGRHKQHPPKAKSHTQHHRTNTGKNLTTIDAPGTGRPISRPGRLTRAPTHKPETGKTALKGLKANQTTAEKGGLKSNEKKRG